MAAVAAGSSGLPKQPRVYVCSSCGRTFKRSEHCIRHERGHTNSKPFPCEFCGRHYARKDLVTRHVQSFHPNGRTERTGNAAAQPSDVDSSLVEERGAKSRRRRVAESSTIQREAQDQSGAGTYPPVEQSQTLQRPLNTDNPLHGTGESSEGSEPNVGSPLGDKPRNQQHASPDAFESLDSQSHLAEPEGESPEPQTSRRRLSSNTAPSYIDPQLNGQWQNDTQLPVVDYNFIPSQSGVSGEADMGRFYTHQQSEEASFFTLLSSGEPQLELDLSILNAQLDYEHGVPEVPWNNLELSPQEMPFQGEGHSPTRSGSSHTFQGPRPLSNAETVTTPQFQLMTEEIYATVLEDVRRDLPSGVEFELPSMTKLQQFMKCYISGFHNNFPILHMPFLVTTPLYTPLILSIAAVGALYSLKRIAAKKLHARAQAMLEPDYRKRQGGQQLPTQAIQTKLLLTIFAVFSGDPADFATSIENCGFWAAEYRIRRAELESDIVDPGALTWAEWSSRETKKRLLCGIFILSSMLTVTYDTTPFLSITQDLDLVVPESEQRWKATSSHQWEQASLPFHNTNLPKVRDVLLHLIFNKPLPQNIVFADASTFSGFATTVVMHAVNIHMWHVMQYTQSFTGFQIEDTMIGHSTVMQVEQGLARCYKSLNAHQKGDGYSPDSDDGPGIFNCQALLRSAYVRVFMGEGSFDRMMLLSENEGLIAARIQSYIQTPQRRNPLLTKAVSMAYGGLRTPISAGFLLVKRTAALTWSVEHAIAAWDCALFVTKWIHSMETHQILPAGPLEKEETDNLTEFRSILAEVDDDYQGSGSLAGDVAAVWAQCLDDTWVWGITPRMSNLLRLLSKAYAEDKRAKLRTW